MERCLDLLAPGGLLGYIMPHKFWQSKYGRGIRDVIVQGRHIRSIVDFTDQQVFRGATTYTAIQVFQQTPNGGCVDVAAVSELIDGDSQCRAIDGNTPAKIPGASRYAAAHPLTGDPWVFFELYRGQLVCRGV